MPRITINTKTTLHKPIEIEINEKIFKVKNLTRSEIKKLYEFDNRIKTGDLDASYERLEFFIGKQKEIDLLTLDQLNSITQFIIKSIFNPEKEEKNLSRPEEKKSH